MSLVPPHPLPLFHAQEAVAGMPEPTQCAVLVASIDATLARLAYEDQPSLEGAAKVAEADLVLLSLFSRIKGTPQ